MVHDSSSDHPMTGATESRSESRLRAARRMPGAFVAGATYPLRALLVLIRTRRLWRYVWIPVLLNLVVGAILYLGLLWAGLRGIDALLAELPSWAVVLSFLLRFLLIVGLLIGIGFILLRFGVVLGSPWYSQLSEELEQIRTGQPPPAPPSGVRGMARDLGRAVLFELQKLVLLVAIGLPLLLLNLIPVIGSILASAGGIVLATVIVCLDFFDQPLERRQLSFRTKLRLVRRSLPGSASFGLVCLGLVTIPLLNLLAIPLCVAAGTLFFCDRIRSEG